MLTYSEGKFREALLLAAVKAVMPRVKRLEQNVLCWYEGTFTDEDGSVRDIDGRLCEIAVDAVTEVSIGIIQNGYKFHGREVEIGHSEILTADKEVCLLSADNVAECLTYGLNNGIWFYRLVDTDGEYFVEI